MPFETLPEGRGRRLRTGSDVALLTVGTTGNAGARAAERAAAAGTSVAHYDLRFVKPSTKSFSTRSAAPSGAW